MQKLVVINYYIYPNYLGGSEIATYELCSRLKRSYHLSLMVNSDQNLHHNLLNKFPIYPIMKTEKKGLSLLLQRLSFFRNLIKINPDIILSFMVTDYSYWALLYARLFHKRILVRAEGSDLNYLGQSFQKLNKILTVRYVSQMLCCSPHHVILSRHFHPRKPPLLLVNGSRFLCPDDPIKTKESNAIYTLLYVGNLRPVKNPPVLIHAMKIICEQEKKLSKPVKLIICGDGPLKSELMKLAEQYNITQRISFEGRVPDERLPIVYKMADIFVLPSISEANPLVLNEAITFGCALCCSNITSLRYFFKPNENALFFDTKNPQTLADCIMKLLTEKELKHQIQKNNIELAKNYSWEAISKQLQNIIENT